MHVEGNNYTDCFEIHYFGHVMFLSPKNRFSASVDTAVVCLLVMCCLFCGCCLMMVL